jgi:ABC-type transport system involved in multi-copper enzyme maturation permease subunit
MSRGPSMPILFKEFAVQMRGSRSALLLALLIGLASIAARLIYGAIVGQLDRGAPLVSAQIGQILFITLSLVIQALIVFLAPATTVNAISSEHERGTFAMLQTTPMTPIQLVAGKLVAAFALLLILILAVLPVFAVVLLFGGVSFDDLVRVLSTMLITALLGSVFGLFCSAATRQTYSATLLCYALLISLVGGTLLAANLWSLLNSMLPAPAIYIFANPLSAMAAALVPARPPDIISFTGSLRPLVLLNLLTRGVIDAGAQGALPLYRASWMLYGGLSLIFFWLTLHLATPRRRWRPGKVDLALLLILLGYFVLAYGARDWWMAGLTRG